MKEKFMNKIKKTKFDKKYLLVLLAITIVIILALINVNNGTSNDGLKYNKNKSFNKSQKVKGIVFENIKCTFDGKDSLISYTMVNETKKTIYLKNYDIIVKDKDNVALTKIVANVTQTIKPKKEVTMSNQVVGVDLTDAYYMELKVNTEKKDK